MADTESESGEWTDRYDPVGSLPLDEALAVLGEETRARIVVELGAAVAPEDARPGLLSFSDLMDRVGIEDSGRFNYHLEKLVGTFVRKADDGYRLRPPGHLFYRALVAGTLTERERLEPFTAGSCPDCGADLTAEYPADHYLYVRCRECSGFFHTVHLPNRGVRDRSREDALEAALRKSRHESGLLREGVCHACVAPVERELRTDDPGVCGRRCEYDVYAILACSACNTGGIGHPAQIALTAPAVVGFFHDHGRDARTVRPWEPVVIAAENGTRFDGESSTAVVPFELGDERLTVRLDDDLQVASVTHTRRSS
ncbi:hypothetical protein CHINAEXTREME_04105 [Halobiforma lacisalsi AJ5]|uniref:ArsR family transcriptional regulator n=1 Tax=Natronobacterium lacisalsi AJ5 TaxID=358396 RepID=M0LNM7_NATLA|nr:hypothetical protein [Halobiforma lacisalsi]APW97002.1 hypothetical protein CHINAEXTREME_04105 [Halobiforma lacisalsi AJ5]EMA34718.1 hypothetical protein C445_07350 [Halobiforma lacisalsi AJ5]